MIQAPKKIPRSFRVSRDLSEQVDQLAKTYDLPYSTVLNLLLREALAERKQANILPR